MYQFNKQISRKQALLSILIVSIIILLSPHMIRSFGDSPNTMISSESYYNAWLADLVQDKIYVIDKDPLSYTTKANIFNPYNYVLSVSSRLAGVEVMSRILPFVLGLFSVFLFYLILLKFKFSENKAFLSAIFFSVSPIFIYIFTVSSSLSFIVFLNLLGLYTFMLGRKYFYFSLFSYMLIPFFGIFNSIASFSILLVYALLNKKERSRIYILLLSILLISFLINEFIFFSIGFPNYIISNIGFWQQFITAIGAKTGFSIFMLFLVASGIIISWTRKKKFYPLYLCIALFLFGSIYIGPIANIYLNLFFAAFAGISVFRLVRREWEYPLIRDLLLYIILLGILFSTVSYIKDIAISDPDQDLILSMDWFKQNNVEEKVVLSHPKNSYLIRYFANQIPFTEMSYTHSYFDHSFGGEERKLIAAKIFHSTILKNVTDLLDNHNISYIFIDKDMKNGLIWKEEKKELLFLLRNREKFKRVHKTRDIEIYEFIGKKVRQ